MSTTQCQMRVKEVEKIARAHKQSITWMLVPRTENYIINLIVTSSNFQGGSYLIHISHNERALCTNDQRYRSALRLKMMVVLCWATHRWPMTAERERERIKSAKYYNQSNQPILSWCRMRKAQQIISYRKKVLKSTVNLLAVFCAVLLLLHVPMSKANSMFWKDRSGVEWWPSLKSNTRR